MSAGPARADIPVAQPFRAARGVGRPEGLRYPTMVRR
jgi:hypothetical protein